MIGDASNQNPPCRIIEITVFLDVRGGNTPMEFALFWKKVDRI